VKIQDLYTIFLENPSISIDSRKPGNGAIFFALRGERFNGNEFAEAAITNGCKYAVIDEEAYAKDDSYLVVSDVLSTLQELAAYHRNHFTIPVIGITGTNGKTTTKELVSNVLESKYNVLSTCGNLNNEIGVPLTVLSFSENTEIAVVEMGANHRGEIARLCQIAKPTHGLITNIGIAHLEGFGSPENVQKAKTELYDFLDEVQGIVFVDEKNEILNTLIQERQIERIPYCDKRFSGKQFRDTDQPCFLSMILDSEGEQFKIRTRLAGSYNFGNVMAALRVGDYFEVEMDEIIKAIESYLPENNRSQIIHGKHNLILLDAYNANPTSMVMAIDNFIECIGKTGMLILGDMLELGAVSMEEHKKLISDIDRSGIHDVILVGSIFSTIASGKDFRTFQTVDDLRKWLMKYPVLSREILIKGSRRIELERVIDLL